MNDWFGLFAWLATSAAFIYLSFLVLLLAD
jgi:hypothetical protein